MARNHSKMSRVRRPEINRKRFERATRRMVDAFYRPSPVFRYLSGISRAAEDLPFVMPYGGISRDAR